ncbi:inositol monophosphatase [Bacteroidota bacterium]|nr:inositol monophosphatase [Bacteroidota bacterium]
MELKLLSQSVIKISKTAGAFIRQQYFLFNEKNVEVKSLNSLVSFVDITAEKMIVEELKNIFPDAGFLTEEKTVEESKAEWLWIIDPLDGTTNFIHGIPTFAVSIGLMHKGKMKLGVVYEIMRDECFSAYKGSQSQLNGKPIYVSERKTLVDSLIATGFPYEKFDFIPPYLKTLSYLMQHTRGIRRIGSAAVDLAYTACGRFDGFFEYNLNPWDVAAGAFIVQQAGGQLSCFSGSDNFIFGREIMAGNRLINRELLQVIQQNNSTSTNAIGTNS